MMKHRLRALAAVALLAVLAVGVPVVMIKIAGWPLPTRMPDWARVRIALQQGDIPAEVVLKTIAVGVWIAWAQLMWALLWEIAVNVPLTTRGQRPRRAPLVAPALGGGVARLVAIAFTVGMITTTTAGSALAQRNPIVATAPPPTTHTTITALTEAPGAVDARVWCVAGGDTLWGIAESALGDGSRVSEILELNPSIHTPRHLHIGDIVRLPDDAHIPTSRIPAETTAHKTAPVDEPPANATTITIDIPDRYLAAETIVIERGDNLWNLAEERLDHANGTPVPDSEVLSYVHQVIADNTAIVEDPNLIYPGEQFDFPAIGTPPPAPVTPAPAPAPPPVKEAPPTTVTPQVAIPEPATPPPTQLPTMAPLPPPTTVVASSPNTSGVTSTSETNSRAVWFAGLSGATVLASGLLLTYRRLRLRQTTAGATTAKPTPAKLRPIETALVAASDVALVRWAGHELAVALTDPRTAATLHGTPTAVEISDVHGIEILWDTPNPTAPSPWEATDDGWAWRLDYDPDHPIPAQPSPPPIPGLVTIGQRHNASVLIDLEHCGSLAITGDAERGVSLLRAWVTELAHDDELANTYLHVIGVPLAGLQHTDRVQQRTETESLDHLRSVASDTVKRVAAAGCETSFQLRTRHDPTGRELTVVIAAVEALEHVEEFIAAAQPHQGVAVVLLDDTPTARTTLTIDEHGIATLTPLGLTVTAAQLPVATVDAIEELIDDATTIIEPAEDEIQDAPKPPLMLDLDDFDTAEDDIDDLSVDAADVVEPSVLIRVLGPPAIPSHPKIGRTDVNLLAFLACNQGSATEDQIIDAVWCGRNVERATLWNHLSKVRSALGTEHIPSREQGDTRVRIGDGISSDLAYLATLVRHAEQASSGEAATLLRRALDLVDGVPFDAAGYDWAHEQQHHARACSLIETATLRLVDLAIDDDDPATARHALNQGLRALRVNEPLYRARMKLEAHIGNHTGVRTVYNELARLLSELADDGETYEPSGRTRALLTELVGATPTSAA
jgi:nucleoid-associated protein YgaU/DNA-binding SARP family transcriptional activator